MNRGRRVCTLLNLNVLLLRRSLMLIIILLRMSIRLSVLWFRLLLSVGMMRWIRLLLV